MQMLKFNFLWPEFYAAYARYSQIGPSPLPKIRDFSWSNKKKRVAEIPTKLS